MDTRGNRDRAPWRRRLLVLSQLWLANVALSCLIASAYLRHGPEDPDWHQSLFLALGLVSCATIVQLFPLLLVGLLALAVRGLRALGAAASLAFTLAQVLLYCDTIVYGMFRYHFNGMVWNVLTTPGADEAVHVSSSEIALVAGGALVLLAAQYALFVRLVRRDERRRELSLRAPLLARPLSVAGLSVLPALVLFAGQYGWSDLVRDRRIMTLSQLFPVSPRITIKRLARDVFGYELAERPAVDLPGEGILLRYPLEPVHLPDRGPRPNLVMLVVDSLRVDMLDPRWMPHTWEFAQDDARVFHDHLSGGNGTRFGLFSMIYGLHGSYWHPFYREQRSPVLLDALLEAGYDAGVFTAASMSYPEMRSTAFVRMEDRVWDRIPSERPGGRDDGVVQRFEEWLETRTDDAPFFTLVLLDAPHQIYYFPEEFALLRPYAESLSYRELAGGATPEQVEQAFNRYKNAVLYADDSVERLLAALRRAGELDDSVVMITGDHGEEFFENGFFGHTSNLTRAQLQVPLVMRGPGIAPGEEGRPTSHADLPATLLELLGLDPALRSRWTLGENLLDPPPTRRRVASGWDFLGQETADGHVLVVPMQAYGGGLELFDAHWKPVIDDEPILRAEGAALGRLAVECRRFLR